MIFVGISPHGDRLHAITDKAGSSPRKALCGTFVDPDERVFDPSSHRACRKCVREATQ